MISFVLVCHDSAHHFPDVVDNIHRSCAYAHEIIVVDNASRDAGYLVGDKVIRNTRNAFFTHAANQGLAASDPRADHLVLINPDIRLDASTFEDLLRDVERTGAGIGAPILVYPDLQVQHAGGEEYASMADGQVLDLHHHEHRHRGEPLVRVRSCFPRHVRWVTGAFFLITRAAFARLGPMCEDFVHYKSDIEYCLRARRRGIGVICSRAVSLHFHKKSSAPRGLVPQRVAKMHYRIRTRRFLARLESSRPGPSR